jgi:hypothetical protein
MIPGENTPAAQNGGLLVVAGHAIYQRGKWHGGFAGEDRFYEEHILDGLRIGRSSGYEAIALSGGHTRDRIPSFPSQEVTNSEGEGMLEFVVSHGLVGAKPPTVFDESYAHDSFENVFFSILSYYQKFSAWPSRVGVVSWKFKAVRFYLIACGLKLGDGKFFFYGSGDPILQTTMETVAVANARYDAAIVRGVGKLEILDPLHRHDEEFASKRIRRMRPAISTNRDYLKQVKAVYDRDFDEASGQQGVVGRLIDAIEAVRPGLDWQSIDWPWEPA